MVDISFLIPTRARTDRLRRLLQSIRDTTANLEALEVVLGIDEDDAESLAFTDSSLRIRRVVVPKGLRMGELNTACFRASSGRFVMLMNDDVILGTKNWDITTRAVLARFDDDIALVHVNDLLFKERLCTFPMLSRRACKAIGVCHAPYRRYRIDDHIYDTYHLLALLGHRRVTYLPDVIFEHQNYEHERGQTEEQLFRTADNKVYVPDEGVIHQDAKEFDETLELRKQHAMVLAALIEGTRAESLAARHRAVLDSVKDSYSYRRPEFVLRHEGGDASRTPNTVTVTVAVVTADLGCDHARECISRIKRFSDRVNLIVLDNNSSSDFNHPREMNRAIRAASTDFLVLLDDDVFVEEGWLDGLLQSLGPNTAAVAPMHKDGAGAISFSGVYLMGDGLGTHAHLTDIPPAPRRVPALCSALLLLDLRKCRHVHFSDRYDKYFLDIDHSFQIWESGYEVVCTPHTTVTHLGGATMPHGSSASRAKWNRDIRVFMAEWIDSGRLTALIEGAWQHDGFTATLTSLPHRIERLAGGDTWDAAEFSASAEAILHDAEPFPLIQCLLVARLRACAESCRQRGDLLRAERCDGLLFRLRHVALVPTGPIPILEGAHGDYNIVEYDGQHYGVPRSLGPVDLQQPHQRARPEIVRAPTADEVRRLIDRIESAPVPTSTHDAQPPAPVHAFEVVGAADGFEFVRYGWKFIAIPEQERPFETAKLLSQSYSRVVVGDSVAMLRAQPRVSSPAGGARTPAKARERRNGVDHGTDHPVLVTADSGDFNIVMFGSKYFAILKTEGAFDIARLRSGGYSRTFVGSTLAEVKRELAAADADRPCDTPIDQNGRILLLTNRPARAVEPLLASLRGAEVSVLTTAKTATSYVGRDTVVARDRLDRPAGALDPDDLSAQCLADIARQGFTTVAIPYGADWNWADTRLERLAHRLAPRLIALFNTKTQIYKGEDIHRLVYNKAYLASMFSVIGDVRGRDVLDVGCSDGLVCQMLLAAGPRHVTGIDVLPTVGCNYPDPAIDYFETDAERMPFEDATFDVVYSIATLEHVPHPRRVIEEMRRVTRPGGFCYVQAGPLFHSPFGHHMFGYFDDYPWIHLRLSPEAIVEHGRARGVEATIQDKLGRSLEDYVPGMLGREHINGLTFEEYELDRFAGRPDVEILKSTRSYEGENLLTPDIARELSRFNRDLLVAHGFELAFRVR